MFKESYKKFFSIIGLVLVLSLGAVVMLEPSNSLTGFTIEESNKGVVPASTIGLNWPSFFFGLFVGVIAIGFLVLIVHYESRRL